MLYNEFLEGTGAIDSPDSYREYKRVEKIYMESDSCTKLDAYRMANVITVKEHEAQKRKAQKKELRWVMENIIPAAAYVRAMAERDHTYNGTSYWHRTPCGNLFELNLNCEINFRSMMLYDFVVNGKQIDISESGYKALPSAEFQSYRANWHDKTRTELEDMFGYIA